MVGKNKPCGESVKIGGAEIFCTKRILHDDPWSEIGSRKQDPIHRGYTYDGCRFIQIATHNVAVHTTT